MQKSMPLRDNLSGIFVLKKEEKQDGDQHAQNDTAGAHQKSIEIQKELPVRAAPFLFYSPIILVQPKGSGLSPHCRPVSSSYSFWAVGPILKPLMVCFTSL